MKLFTVLADIKGGGVDIVLLVLGLFPWGNRVGTNSKNVGIERLDGGGGL